jgi:AraC-like DNA-binding protein
MNNRWHFHPEVELILFHRGCGMQFVGDSILPFQPNDVVLVGANLPHYWRFDDQYMHEDALDAPFTTVAHFTETFWGAAFLNLPENKHIKALLYQAQRGVLLRGAGAAAVQKCMQQLPLTSGTRRIMALLDCLLAIAASPDLTLLASAGFGYDTTDVEDERLNQVYHYTLANFRSRITLAEISEVAGLARNSFCRYFKNRMGKSYFRFLLEIRVSNAQKLLANSNLAIRELGNESGFNNNADFHKNFKQLTGKTPLGYQREVRQRVPPQGPPADSH